MSRDERLLKLLDAMLLAKFEARSGDEADAFWKLIVFVKKNYGPLPMSERLVELTDSGV
jgi:hypothetical protein